MAQVFTLSGQLVTVKAVRSGFSSREARRIAQESADATRESK